MKKIFAFLGILGFIFWMGGNAFAAPINTYDYVNNNNGSSVYIDTQGTSPSIWFKINFPGASGTYLNGAFEYDSYVDIASGIESFRIFMDGNKDSTDSSHAIEVFLGFGGTSPPASKVKIASFNPANGDSSQPHPFTFTADILNGTASYLQDGTTHDLGSLLNGVNKQTFKNMDSFWVGYACHFYEVDTGVHVGVNSRAVPEPMSLLFLGTGLLGLVAFRRGFKK